MKPPSNEVLEKVRGEFGLNERRVRDAVEHLKDWIQLQPHLPKEIGTFWLIFCAGIIFLILSHPVQKM